MSDALKENQGFTCPARHKVHSHQDGGAGGRSCAAGLQLSGGQYKSHN